MKLNTITLAITLIAGCSIFAALAYNGSQMAPKGPEQNVQVKAPTSAEQQLESTLAKALSKNAASQAQQVAVINVQANNYQAEVVGHGEAKSRYELNFSAEVSGRIEQVSSLFESGQVIKKGTVIASIDDTSYRQALTQAQADVEQAKLNLLEEQRQGEQAKSEWERSGLTGEPDSPLVLRTPQLAQVTAALDNAQLALKTAQQNLDRTQVKAPFDALVVSRDIQPGSYVQTGTQVATLYSVDEIEIDIPLSEAQWRNLPSFDNAELAQTQWPVLVESSDGAHQWQGYVGRIEQHLSSQTRQRSLIVVVEKPLEQNADLYPGTFVKAAINGRSLEQLWQLPSSAVSQQGELWFVDEHGQLNKSAADTQFEKDGFVYISPSSLNNESSVSQVQIVKRPLSSFQVGTLVTAKVEG